jgi:hypothetical protein
VNIVLSVALNYPYECRYNTVILRSIAFCQTGPNAWRYRTPTVPMGSVQPMFTHQLNVVVASLNIRISQPHRDHSARQDDDSGQILTTGPNGRHISIG